MRELAHRTRITGVAATLFAVSLSVSAQTSAPEIVTLAWPGDNAVDLLEKRYAKVVTYEDPIWVWRGELAPNPQAVVQTGALYPPRPVFRMPAASAGTGLATDLANVLSLFQLSNGTTFGVQSSKLGLHLIPTLVHDESGALVPAKNLLDAYVTVPREERTAYQHVEELCVAIGRATGVKVKPGINHPQAWESEFSWDHASFSWGANSETGREAIIDLLDRSATSMSWTLVCIAGADTLHDHTCGFNIRSVPISITDPAGRPQSTILLFDRCPKCAPEWLKPQLAPNH